MNSEKLSVVICDCCSCCSCCSCCALSAEASAKVDLLSKSHAVIQSCSHWI